MSFEDARDPMDFDEDQWVSDDGHLLDVKTWAAMDVLLWLFPK